VESDLEEMHTDNSSICRALFKSQPVFLLSTQVKNVWFRMICLLA
jgi:hypothetical protein